MIKLNIPYTEDTYMDNFELINFDDFNNFYETKEEDIVDDINFKLCIKCKIHMNYKITNEYICPKCGLTKDKVSIEDDYNEVGGSGYNTFSCSNIALKCVGTESYKYRYLLRNSSSYSIVQENHIRSILYDLNYNAQDINIPKDILLTVCNQYKLIRESKNIYRGQILKGILASLTYYECIKNKLTYRPKEIAEWFDIDSINLSKGDKILRNLSEKGIINLNLEDITINDNFIHSYMLRINIDIKYCPFLYELMEQINTHRIVNPNAKSSTHAVVVIYILIICLKLKITQEQLYNEFKVSVSTFKKMTLNVIKHKNILKDTFEKYNIPIVEAIPKTIRRKKIKKNKS